jgi:nitroreductase
MELKHAIENRTSIRTFLNDPVPANDLKELVRRAGLAPSVNNYQPWMFYAITNKPIINKMANKVAEKIKEIPINKSIAAKNVLSQVEWFATFFENAPAVIAVTMENYETVLEKGVTMTHEEINKIRNYPNLQSAGAAIQNILLSAVEMNYGACWLSAPMIAKSELEKIIGIQQPFQLIAFVAVGKPTKNNQAKTKKNIDEIFKLID